MPSYSYKCLKCEATCTVTQAVNQNVKIPKCLACNENMVRVYGDLSVQFKGGGWGGGI